MRRDGVSEHAHVTPLCEQDEMLNDNELSAEEPELPFDFHDDLITPSTENRIKLTRRQKRQQRQKFSQNKSNADIR